MTGTFQVKFRSFKHHFVGLSLPAVTSIVARESVAVKPGLCFEVISSNEASLSTAASDHIPRYVCWQGDMTRASSELHDVLEIDPDVASQLGLKEFDHVMLRFVTSGKISRLERCHVRPSSASDWEILSLFPNVVEAQLLSQARLIQLGVPFIFWLHGQTKICLDVVSLEPEGLCVGLLGDACEVVVEPRPRPPPQRQDSTKLPQKPLLARIVRSGIMGSDISPAESLSIIDAKLTLPRETSDPRWHDHLCSRSLTDDPSTYYLPFAPNPDSNTCYLRVRLTLARLDEADLLEPTIELPSTLFRPGVLRHHQLIK